MLAVALTAIAAAYLAISLFVLARRTPGYSHVRHTISEIGETGAPHQRFVALGVFLPIGVALLIVAYLLHDDSSAASALAIAIAVGYVGAAAFPCDPGSPLSGSARQSLHNLAGGVEYIGGGFALMTLARDLGGAFQIIGFVVLAAAIALSVMPSTSIRGAIQRIAEACLFGGLASAAWCAVRS
jgi:uncharacterized protein DUF998